MTFIIGVAVGLVVGWNFFPQPAIVAEKVALIRSKLTK
jgi:hypothetical protein